MIPQRPTHPFDARKLVVTVVGGTVVLLGLLLLVLPGPAFVVLPLGLAILATEFVWARRMLGRVRRAARKTARLGSQSAFMRWVRSLRRRRVFYTIGRGY